MKKIISVIGARPNFMKIGSLHRAFLKYKAINPSTSPEHLICHTGQHYDDKMSKVFFDQLKLPQPDFYLGVGSGSHAEQTAKIMVEFEKVCLKEKPDLIIVVGDVNSTIACSLVASKMGIKIAHVEAGLRSFDNSMPEEINRILTDRISDYLFITEKSGEENLKREGVKDEKIFFTGNTMIDSLITFLPAAERSSILKDMVLERGKYLLITMHRPSNVDNLLYLKDFISLLNELTISRKAVFPVHPRTKKNLTESGIDLNKFSNIIFCDPAGYLDFLALTKNAELIITDSGGIQEESTYLGVQCITVRNNTERPVTVIHGTNTLAGTDLNIIRKTALQILNGDVKKGTIPDLWDGKAGERIVEILVEKLSC